MLFNSYIFIFLFLPLTLAGYYFVSACGHRLAAAWLVATSLFFYSWWNPAFTPLLLGSIVFNYYCGLVLQRTKARRRVQGLVLTLGVGGDVLLLFVYKYLFPLLNWLSNHGFPIRLTANSLALPLGISFFTFTQIGYLIDIKGGATSDRKPLDYLLFVTFFPHLIAGPILHHSEMMPQFEDGKTYRLDPENLAVGITMFTIGLAKKLILADRLAPLVSLGFDSPAGLSFFAAWSAALCFTLQLYFDFSGYSDMAIGLARMFGIRFPSNFYSPYKARSIIDFWQRWHSTLTRYLNLYLYNPCALWVTRRRIATGRPISRQASRTISGFLSMVFFPTFYTMILAGIWHGAGLQFLVFGLMHASYLTVNQCWRTFRPKKAEMSASKIYSGMTMVFQVLLTFIAVLLANVVFRASSLVDAMALFSGMVGRNGLGLNEQNMSKQILETTHLLTGFEATGKILLFFFVVYAMPNTQQIVSRFAPVLGRLPEIGSVFRFEWRPNAAWGTAIGILGAITVLYLSGATEFLYFQF